PHGERDHQRHQHAYPHVGGELVAEHRRDQCRGGHRDAGRQVELAADHQQGDRDRRDAVRGRHVQDRRQGTRVPERWRHDEEDDVDDDGAEERTDLGPGEQPGQWGPAAQPLVARRWRWRLDADVQGLTHEDLRVFGSGRGPRSPAGSYLTGTARGELADEVDVALVHQVRAGQRGLATAEDVAVGLVQPQGVDGLVALQPRLLVDGPLQVARLDLRRDLRVEVERADLRLAAGVLGRVDGVERDRRAERDDEVDARVLLQLRRDGRAHRRQVRTVHVDLVVRATGERRLHAVTAGFELDLPLELDDAQHMLETVVGGLLA